MNDPTINTLLLTVLIGLVAWMGNKLYNKIASIDQHIAALASELHTRINGLEVRVTKIETRCKMEHIDK